jgi:diguanylate cyclase (GGDEF)-like protein
VGVLTLYSAEAQGFNEDHQRVIEVAARQIAYTLKCAAEFDGSPRRDPVTGLPNITQLQQLLESAGVDPVATASGLTLLLIDVVGLKQTNLLHGRTAGDKVLNHVVRHTRTALRVADILFRYGSDEFVALLNKTDAHTGADIARRIRRVIREHGCPIGGGKNVDVDVAVSCVCAPEDGDSLTSLIGTARSRSGPQSLGLEGPIVH